MAQGVVPNIPFYYLPTKNCFVADNDGFVRFENFGVGKSVPLKEHAIFITSYLVPHYIKVIDAIDDPNRSTFEIPAIGQASATGKADRNQALSEARVAAIGALISGEFEKQKVRSTAASRLTVVVKPDARGDKAARKVREDVENKEHGRFTDRQVDTVQGGYRSVMVAINAYDRVEPTQVLYQCRELYEVDFKIERKPANHLEEVVDDLDKQLGTFGKLVGAGVIKIIVWRVQKAFKYQIKNFLKNASKLIEDIPELKMLMLVVDFIIPEDIDLLFEFRDFMSKTAIYAYSGSINKKDTSDTLKILMYILSIRRYLQKLEAGLRLGLAHPRLAPLKPQIQVLLNEVVVIEQEFDRHLDGLTGANGPVRRFLGDALTDFLLALVRKDPPPTVRVPVSAWSAPFPMADNKYYDVKSFGGPARTTSWDLLFKTHITLEFAGRDEHGYLGYAGTTEVVSDVSAQNQALGAGVSNGRLLPA